MHFIPRPTLHFISFFCAFFIGFSLPSFAQDHHIDAIKHVLYQQQAAWNRGDIHAYMQGYWKSDSLRFIGKSGVTTGWEATEQRYLKSYPDTNTMGKLHFDVVSIEPIEKHHYLMIGKWYLTRKVGNVGGYFMLLWKQEKENWVIMIDHSS